MAGSSPFCPCTEYTCEFNPINHDDGCNRCVQDSLVTRELPRCFFKTVRDDLDGVTDWFYAHFARLTLGEDDPTR